MAGCETWVRRLPLPSDQLAVLSSQVRHVCDLEPGDDISGTHITSMRTLVARLTPVLHVNWGIFRNIRIGRMDGGWPGAAQGNTTEGVAMPVAKHVNMKKPGFRFPRDGVAIGGFIAERYHSGRYDRGVLTLTPFLDIELSSIDPSMLRPRRRIEYRLDSLEPVVLTKELPQAGWLTVSYRPQQVWKSRDTDRV